MQMKEPLSRLIAAAREQFSNMTPAQREAMLRDQARSFARAEAAFGSDADEVAMRDAISRGDSAAVARLTAEGDARAARLFK